LVLLVNFVLYVATIVRIRSYSPYYYRAYVGVLTSYGVVVYKSFGGFQFTTEFRQRLLMDENVQYLILAFYWYCTAPIFVTLIPFATFSTFHVLSYFRTNIIPTFFPTKPGTAQAANGVAPASSGIPAQLSEFIKRLTDQNYGPAMQFVSNVEVIAVMGWLLLGTITFQISFMALLIYAHFLRSRYLMSSYTRNAFKVVSATLDKLLLSPAAPPFLGKAYNVIKGLVIRYGQSTVEPPPIVR